MKQCDIRSGVCVAEPVDMMMVRIGGKVKRVAACRQCERRIHGAVVKETPRAIAVRHEMTLELVTAG